MCFIRRDCFGSISDLRLNVERWLRLHCCPLSFDVVPPQKSTQGPPVKVYAYGTYVNAPNKLHYLVQLWLPPEHQFFFPTSLRGVSEDKGGGMFCNSKLQSFNFPCSFGRATHSFLVPAGCPSKKKERRDDVEG